MNEEVPIVRLARGVGAADLDPTILEKQVAQRARGGVHSMVKKQLTEEEKKAAKRAYNKAYQARRKKTLAPNKARPGRPKTTNPERERERERRATGRDAARGAVTGHAVVLRRRDVHPDQGGVS